jgi:hypothetical protein
MLSLCRVGGLGGGRSEWWEESVARECVAGGVGGRRSGWREELIVEGSVEAGHETWYVQSRGCMGSRREMRQVHEQSGKV